MPLLKHPLIQFWRNLKGNPRACVYPEPLWGIAFNLYAPFATLYMSYLGVTDSQIGMLLTLGMIVQIITSLLGSVLIDKMGRRWSALLLGLLAWTIPPALLMLAQDFWWFFAATLFGGIGLIESVAWNCLLVEDAKSEQLVDIFNWVTISGLLSVFFAPLAGLMVRSLSLVPAMRILYGFALLMMTAKTLTVLWLSRETKQGLIRMQETRHVSYARLLGQYRGVLRLILNSPASLQVLAVIILIQIANTISSNFFALFATQNAGVPEWLIAYFPMGRSAIMLAFIFGIQRQIARFRIKQVMIVGLMLYLAALSALLLSPYASFLLAVYVLLDAFAFALVWPRRNSLLALQVDPKERARILGLMYVLMSGFASPFGWIAGWLSEISRARPFLLNMLLYASCALVLWHSRKTTGDDTI